MDRRQALNLLGLGGIGALLNGRSPARAYSSQSVQLPSELAELERRVATYIIEGRNVSTNFLTQYHVCTGCGEYVDKTTGKDMGEEVVQRMRRLYDSDPAKVEGKNPEDIFSDIVLRVYRSGQFRIEGDGFAASVDVRVYKDNAQELNWNDTKNYLKLSWTDSQFESTFTDNGIDGIVDESSIPVVANKQQDFLQHLQRIENIFLQK